MCINIKCKSNILRKVNAMSQDKAKNILDALLESTDYAGVLSEDHKASLATMINEAVDTRVNAKVTLLEEEFKAKEKALTEQIDAEKQKVLKEAEENEKVLVEQAEAFKAQIAETALNEVKAYRENVEKTFVEKASTYRKEIESLVFNEAKEYKKKKDAATVEEVKNFKEDLITKVNDFIEAKLVESLIPSEILEAATKLEVYQPLVESVMGAFSKNFIKLDDTSYALIKESKSEIERLKNEVQELHKKNVTLAKEKKEVERNYKIEELIEGFTDAQKARARTLLEGHDIKDLQTRFNQIKDIIVESVSTVKKPVEKPVVKTEKVITEGVKPEVTQQEKTAVAIQQKKVLEELKESEIKVQPKKEEQKPSVNQSWITRIQPKHSRG